MPQRFGVCALAAACALAAGAAAAAGTAGGGYAGATAQGKRLTFALSADGKTLAGVRATLVGRCGKRLRARALALAAVRARADGSFAAALGGLRFTARVADGGAAAGTLEGAWTAQGIRCSAAAVRWSARPLSRPAQPAEPALEAAPAPAPAPPPAPAALTGAGTYCGFTVQSGKSICFDVGPSGRAITRVKVEIVSDCGSGEWLYKVTSEVQAEIALDDDRTFAYTFTQQGLEGTELSGAFDGAGNATGRVRGHMTFEQDGRRWDCVGDPVDWNAKLGA